MKYKTLCRLLVKLLGIFFLTSGTMGVLTAVGEVIFNEFLGTTQHTWAYHGGFVAIRVFSQWPIGLFLFFRSEWITNRLIPSNRPYCHDCGYDLTGAAGNICPECGTPFKVTTTDPEPHH